MKPQYFLPLFLGGCSIIPAPGESPTRYFLEKITLAGDEGQADKKISSKQIAIDMPIIYAPLDINRIALLPEKNQLDYYANMEWSDRLSLLLRESLVQSLQDAHFYSGVSRMTDGINPDQILKIDVRKFYILKTKDNLDCKFDKKSIKTSVTPPESPPVACVELFVTLVDAQSRHSLGDQTFEARIPIPEETKEYISGGLNEANKRVLIDLMNWLKNYV